MRILNISLDKKLFEKSSNVKERVFEYARLFERFDILVLAEGRKLEFGNMAVWPAGSFCKIFSVLKAYNLGKKMIKKYKNNLISTQDPFFTGLVGWLLKRKTSLPLQIQIHTDFLNPYFRGESLLNKIRAYLGKFLILRADGIRVVSGRIKKSLINNGYSSIASRVFVLPIFIDIEKIQRSEIKNNLKQKYPQFDFIILMASRLTREKNIKLAISVFKEISKKHLKAGLIIIGDGPEEKSLKFEVKSLQLEKNIFFEPWTEDLASYYKTADAFFLTSNYEGYGLTVVEAMACGLPVIMTDVGCANEILKNGESGLVVPVGNKQKLEQAVLELINSVELRKKISNNAKKAAERLALKEEILELYKKSSEDILLHNQ